MANLFITLIVCGLWHGADWLFVIWGAYQSLLFIAFRVLKYRGWLPSNDKRIGYWFNRQLTFLLMAMAFVLTRAADVHTDYYSIQSVLPAFWMLKQMAGFDGMGSVAAVPLQLWLLIAFSWVWCNFAPNSFEVAYNAPPLKRYALAAGLLMAVCVLQINQPVDFLYFRF